MMAHLAEIPLPPPGEYVWRMPFVEEPMPISREVIRLAVCIGEVFPGATAKVWRDLRGGQ